MKRRMLVLALAALMACALLPATALAAGYTEVIPCKYDNAYGFSEGLARVERDGKQGFIDKTGQEVIPCKYDYAGDFSEGLAEVEKDGKYGFIDKTGQEIVPCKYDFERDFFEGLAAVRIGSYGSGKYGFIDKTGQEVVPCKYDDVNMGFSEGLAAVAQDGKYGFIDKTGQEVIPCRYYPASSFSEGLAAVSRDFGSTWGFIDMKGQEVIPCKYYFASDFSEGLAAVEIGDYHNSKWGFVDKTGKEVVPCKYDGASSFSEGLAQVKQGGKWGYIDKTGKEVVPCKYDRMWNFSEGLSKVSRDFGSTWGFIDMKGQEVVPCKYDDAGSFSEGLAAVKQDGKWGFIAVTDQAAPAANIAHPSTQEVDVDGEKITFQCYALKDAAGNDTNYIKLRDLADILNGSAAQFQVGWDGNVTITTGQVYTKNGSEQNTPFSGQRAYEKTAVTTLVNGKAAQLDTFQLKDDNGGGYTYYKLRDLGKALGITVGWTAERGVFIETK